MNLYFIGITYKYKNLLFFLLNFQYSCMLIVNILISGKDNAVVKFLIKCLKCCFWCLEKFMKFLNKNAYILVSFYFRQVPNALHFYKPYM